MMHQQEEVAGGGRLSLWFAVAPVSQFLWVYLWMPADEFALWGQFLPPAVLAMWVAWEEWPLPIFRMAFVGLASAAGTMVFGLFYGCLRYDSCL